MGGKRPSVFVADRPEEVVEGRGQRPVAVAVRENRNLQIRQRLAAIEVERLVRVSVAGVGVKAVERERQNGQRLGRRLAGAGLGRVHRRLVPHVTGHVPSLGDKCLRRPCQQRVQNDVMTSHRILLARHKPPNQPRADTIQLTNYPTYPAAAPPRCCRMR